MTTTNPAATKTAAIREWSTTTTTETTLTSGTSENKMFGQEKNG